VTLKELLDPTSPVFVLLVDIIGIGAVLALRYV
jgi:hypothetical protein